MKVERLFFYETTQEEEKLARVVKQIISLPDNQFQMFKKMVMDNAEERARRKQQELPEPPRPVSPERMAMFENLLARALILAEECGLDISTETVDEYGFIELVSSILMILGTDGTRDDLLLLRDLFEASEGIYLNVRQRYNRPAFCLRFRFCLCENEED